jgi:hypothetical protein
MSWMGHFLRARIAVANYRAFCTGRADRYGVIRSEMSLDVRAIAFTSSVGSTGFVRYA